MKDVARRVFAPFVLVVLALTVLATLLPVTTASADSPFWTPGVTLTDASCDGTWEHKMRARHDPGQDLVLTIVPPSNISVVSISGFYSLNGGVTQEVTQTWSNSVTIPGGTLTEGTTIDYAISVSFSRDLGYSGPCSATAAATIPHTNGFRTSATIETSIMQAPYATAVVYSMGSLSPQPQFGGVQPTIEQVCSIFFAATTPCTELENARAVIPSLPVGEPDGPRPLVDASATATSCMYAPPNQWISHFPEPTRSSSGLGAGSPGYEASQDKALGRVYLASDVTAYFSSAWTQHAEAWAGFFIGWDTSGSDNGFPADIETWWRVAGQRQAAASSGMFGSSSSASPKFEVRYRIKDTFTDGWTAEENLWASQTNAASTSGGWGGLSGPFGMNPFADPEVKGGLHLKSNFFIRYGRNYHVYAKLLQDTVANAGAGGAYTQVNNKDSAEGWDLRVYAIRVTPNDSTKLSC